MKIKNKKAVILLILKREAIVIMWFHKGFPQANKQRLFAQSGIRIMVTIYTIILFILQ